MKKETEKTLMDLAYIIAESVITTNILFNKGIVNKNVPYIQNVDKNYLNKLPKELNTDLAIQNIDIFNDILCNVLEKRLDWYNLEGFSEELENSYRFYSSKEISQKNEELYGEEYGQD